MKSTEFRLKNLVWNDVQNIPCPVDFKILNDIHHGINDWKPIQLTEDWLIMFGFVEDTCKNISNPWSDFVKSHVRVQLPYFEFVFNDGDGSIELKYVHQLQNLYFALTGEELTLNHVL